MTEQSLAQCEGQIAGAFRELKAVYEKLRTDLVDSTARILALETALKGAPPDFQYPKGTPNSKSFGGVPD